MIPRIYLLPLSLLASGVVAVAPASATIVFADDFADNDRTTDPAWFTIGSPAAVVINQEDGVLSLGRTQSNSHTYLASNWSGTALGDVGDELAFSFTVKLTGDQGNRPNEIMFGIGNNNGTVPTADNQNVFVDDFGYIAALGTSGGASGLLRDAGTEGFLGRAGSGDHTDVASGLPGLAITDTFQTYTLTLTRTAGGMDLAFTDGSTLVEVSDNSVPNNDFYTFNTVTFGYYNRNTENFLDVSSIDVTYSPIPEPSAYAALFGLGALIAFLLRRRMRR
ncbi:MAG: PEP-CTERM sorting domain-containing protein [Opitutales bacterium]|nr:PEP-CTERM sorting domain-containing protein [Opitutales bacterium]